MRKFLLTLTALVPLCFAMPTEADAKVRVNLFFGIPYYSHSLGSDYRFYPGRGWYRDHRPYTRQKISCQRARKSSATTVIATSPGANAMAQPTPSAPRATGAACLSTSMRAVVPSGGVDAAAFHVIKGSSDDRNQA